MTNRELLELAVKAAGVAVHHWSYADCPDCPDAVPVLTDGINTEIVVWNPLADDGDALRLAVALNIEYVFQSICIVVAKVSRIGGSIFDKRHSATVDYVPEEMFASSYGPDISHANYLVSTGMIRGKAPAVRLAIVRAAAEIGMAMK